MHRRRRPLANEINEQQWVDQGAGEADRLQRLWAPYRKAYIAAKSEDPFLEAPKKSDEDGLIVARGEKVYALLNLYPYNAGHMLVVPYRKVSNLEDLDFEESVELFQYTQMAIRVLKHVSSPHAVNVGMNLGGASGGSVRDHLHMHVVPRWQGDANFVTIIDGIKVLPELLADTRSILAEGWAEIAAENTDNEGVNNATDA
ncbi:HIT family protein [Corynebacterium pseudodiphtheriticum]|uniref:HIT family protein n=1 Tax=Corynebacterium pseudodiphtheriticum TaxID=37637 RepID=UPI000F8722EF|nr:HIT domain-containing protein [Corynebacterium pseudodiphtheriticum]